MSSESAAPSGQSLRFTPSARTLALALVGAVVLVYARLWWAGFIWDDDDYVIDNMCLRSLNGLGRIWFSPGSTPQYYPLTHTSFWIEYQLWGLRAPLYHFVNVLLHAANALLLWAVLHRLAVPAAWLGAALFALHPVEVESVAWITERKNTLSAFFGLLFVLAWLRYRFGAPEQPIFTDRQRSPNARPADLRWLAVATALFVASLLCKTVTITLVGVVLVISWWKTGRISRADLVGIAPLLLIGLPLALTTVAMERTTVGAIGEEWSLSPADRIVLAGRVIVFYFAKLVWPQPLIFFYPRWTVSSAATWQWTFPIAVVAALGTLWFFRYCLGRGPLAAALIFIGMLVPALGFFDVYPFQYSFVADHFQYHASASAVAALGAATAMGAARLSDFRLRTVSLAGWLVVLATISATQTRSYLSLEHLYRHVLILNPTCFIAANNLGGLMLGQNRADEAEALFELARLCAVSTKQKSLALWNLCQAGLYKQDLVIVDACSAAAYELRPTIASRSMRALALIRMNRSTEAQRLLSDDSRDFREDRVARSGILDVNRLAAAEIAISMGDTTRACNHLRSLIEGTTDGWMMTQAAAAFARLGFDDEAAKLFGMLRHTPPFAGISYYHLGELAIDGCDLGVAEQCLTLAIESDPTLLDARILLARILNRKGRTRQARELLGSGPRTPRASRELTAELQHLQGDR